VSYAGIGPEVKDQFERLIRPAPRLFEQLVRMAKTGGEAKRLADTLGTRTLSALVRMGAVDRVRGGTRHSLWRVTPRGWALLAVGCPCCGHVPWVARKGAKGE
jgi:hypothetical protein